MTLEPAALRSRVKYSTNEPLHSLVKTFVEEHIGSVSVNTSSEIPNICFLGNEKFYLNIPIIMTSKFSLLFKKGYKTLFNYYKKFDIVHFDIILF